MGRGIKKIVCCDTIHHLTPILRGWYYGFYDLGYECSYLPIPQYSILDLQEAPDLIIYAGVKPSHLPMFKAFREKYPECIVVGTTAAFYSSYSDMQGYVDHFVTLLDSAPYMDESFKTIGYDLIHTPLAGNNHLFYPISDASTKIYDMCFIGGLSHGDRGEHTYLYPLLDDPNNKCYLAGMSYKHHGGFMLPYEKANEIRNATKVNINFHFPYQKLGEGDPADRVDLNQSVYNIALSGQFQLCDHALVEMLFGDSIPLASKEDWMDAFNYFKKNQDEAAFLAKKAYNIAINNHTWKARMNAFLTKIKKLHEK